MEEGKTVQARPLARGTLRLQSDERLLKLFRRGVEPAFDELVRRYRDALVGYAGSIAGRDRAEDVVQDSLVKAHRSLVADRDIEPRPWLYAVVRNTALNDVRDNRKHRHDDLGDSAGVGGSPGDLVEQRERFAAVLAAVADLPPAQRRALVDHELSGFSHEEIAAELELSTGATKQLIYRARLSLRNAFGALIPLPLIAWLAEGSGVVATGAAGGGATATGLISGLGGGGAAKLAVVAVVAGGSLAGGIAVEKQRNEKNPGGQNPARTVGTSAAGSAVSESAPATILTGSGENDRGESSDPGRGEDGDQQIDARRGSGSGELSDEKSGGHSGGKGDDDSGSSGSGGGEDRPSGGSGFTSQRPEPDDDSGHGGPGGRPERGGHDSGSSGFDDDPGEFTSGPRPGSGSGSGGGSRPSGGSSGGPGPSGGHGGSSGSGGSGGSGGHSGSDDSGSSGSSDGSDDSGFDD